MSVWLRGEIAVERAGRIAVHVAAALGLKPALQCWFDLAPTRCFAPTSTPCSVKQFGENTCRRMVCEAVDLLRQRGEVEAVPAGER